MFMESAIEGRKTFLVLKQGQQEYITLNEEFKEVNLNEDKFFELKANRYMHVIPNGQSMTAGFPDYDLFLNAMGIIRLEVVGANSERWKEIEALFKGWKLAKSDIKVTNKMP